MSDEVRLIVWDLDETFWHGTLSEEGITEYSAANHDAVVSLARRGIMSSICSKNDHEQVRKVLLEKGLWSYFIFPSIEWTAKAPRLRAIIDAVQLRPENILFIDDNPSNRAEATALIPDLMVSDETIVASLLVDPRCRGKSDPGLARLKAYKVLEAKSADRSHFEADIQGFLRGSEIVVTIDYEIDQHIDRIVEILNRTNQLNFTKRRLPEDIAQARAELRSQLDTVFARRAATVKVSDKYGNYGIVGFWALEGYGTELRLLHFAFSCRILGMGVEQWVYEKLGAPALDVVGSVVSKLDFSPDWINRSAPADREVGVPKLRAVYLRGACELEILKHYFSFASERAEGEFVFVRGVLTVWRSHIVSMFPQEAMRSPEAGAALERLGFSQEDFGSQIFSIDRSEPALIVVSPSADAAVPLYEHKRHGFVVPILEHGLADQSSTSAAEIDAYATRWNLDIKARAALHEITAELKSDYTFIGPGQIDLGPYYARLVDQASSNIFLVFLLPAAGEMAVESAAQREVNGMIRKASAGNPNVRCVEVSNHIKSTKKILDPSRFHLDRAVYHSIYQEISSLHAAWSGGTAAGPRPDQAKMRERRSAASSLRDNLRKTWRHWRQDTPT